MANCLITKDQKRLAEWHREIFGWSEDILPWEEEISKTLPFTARWVTVGAYRGRSMLFLADCLQRQGKTAARVIGIDAAVFEVDSPLEWTRARNTVHKEWGNGPRVQVELRVAWSPEAAEDFPDGWADGVFIDGSHTEEGAEADIIVWRRKVRPGGILAGHDYKEGEFGVKAAVDRLLPGFERVPDSSLWVYRC